MENTSIPPVIQPLIDAYLCALEPLHDHLYGIYIFGSIALGAFEEARSDIDILVLTQGEWLLRELKQLEDVHASLLQEQPFGKRLEVQYLPVADLGKTHHEDRVAPYPNVHDRQFSPAGHGDLNGITWWILKYRGICLLGPEPADLPFDYEWQQILLTMRYNLDIYFASKLKRPYIYLNAEVIEFAVTNLCRILSTVEDGEIVSKSASLQIWRSRLPKRWQSLLAEAWRVRHQPEQRPVYRFPLRRVWDMVAFIRYVQERGGRALDIALAKNVRQS